MLPSLEGRMARVWRGVFAALLTTGVALGAWLPPASASGDAAPAAIAPEIAVKMDARLVAAATMGGTDPVPVWIALADKGEQGPEDLARRLDQARAALTPRNLARRLRAHVFPLVDDRDLPVHAPYLEALAREGLATYGVSRWQNAVAARIAPARLAAIAALPFVARMSPVQQATRAPEARPTLLPISPREAGAARLAGVSASYGLTLAQLAQIAIPALHDSGYTGAGVLVCLIDDGFNYYQRQEALAAQPIAPGLTRDFVEGDTTVQDTTSFSGLQHGSWTFGILGGNKPGTYLGAAYGASYALARTEVDFFERQIEMTYWQQAAEWADSLGADLISSSLAYRDFDPPDPTYTYAQMDGHTTIVTQAAEIAASKGILIVNAVGNEGATAYGRLLAPSDVNGDSLIAVGAVDANGALASFSSRGPSGDGRIKPDLVALGVANPVVNVAVANPFDPGLYTANSGTSFSTPLVAGLAACLLQARPRLTPVEIIRALRATASLTCMPNDDAGYGLPNGYAALRVSAPVTGVAGGKVSMLGPNPLRAGQVLRVTFDPSLVSSGRVRVLDLQGHQVRELCVTGAAPIALWDGRNDDGQWVHPGIYFLQSGHRDAAARVVFLR
jgi:subtilisin family serine protease